MCKFLHTLHDVAVGVCYLVQWLASSQVFSCKVSVPGSQFLCWPMRPCPCLFCGEQRQQQLPGHLTGLCGAWRHSGVLGVRTVGQLPSCFWGEACGRCSHWAFLLLCYLGCDGVPCWWVRRVRQPDAPSFGPGSSGQFCSLHATTGMAEVPGALGDLCTCTLPAEQKCFSSCYHSNTEHSEITEGTLVPLGITVQ